MKTLTLFLIGFIIYTMISPINSKSPVILSSSEIKINSDECNVINYSKKERDSILNSAFESKNFIGLSTALSINNCNPWIATGGFLDKKNNTKPNSNSLFRIASISKSMTAIAILQLYENKKLELDVPIQTYLPEFPKKNKGNITIRQLLNHTSGVKHYYWKLGIFHFKNYSNSVDALKRFKHKELAFKPGSSFLYSTYGYTILGAIIERVSGQTYEEYMKEHIWKPANMTNTCTEKKDFKYINKASLYIKTGLGYLKSPKNNLSYSYSGGGIISTAEDLIKFGKGIINYKFINAKTTELMVGDSLNKSKRKYRYGWDNWSSTKHGKVIEHNGTQLGASSFFRIYLDKKIVVATLTNNMNSSEEVRSLSINLSNSVLKRLQE